MYYAEVLPAIGNEQTALLQRDTFWEWRIGMRKGCYITEISSRGQDAPCEDEEMEFFTWLYKDLFKLAEERRRAYVNGKMPSGRKNTESAEDGKETPAVNGPVKRYETAAVRYDPVPARKKQDCGA